VKVGTGGDAPELADVGERGDYGDNGER